MYFADDDLLPRKIRHGIGTDRRPHLERSGGREQRAPDKTGGTRDQYA
jgi:hypothetical protein